ncbi:endonuclease/exonuclease/phosphatase family protein [Chachezhania antarctica]|uniref:endonuclease/exonuclease/phosphatase family protein n=1 Tax=Chachezhania antarctica TaxID=2340860 RepID=UPI001F0976C3|nr:endonuclease/exonuclease/phosphatase family protein [Chachezhania antarctica]
MGTYNAELSRDGPGVLLRDIERDDEQVAAVVAVIAATSPDILALQSIDWDYDGAALTALTDKLDRAGAPYPYRFFPPSNRGHDSGVDLDGDGRIGGPGDAWGFGEFTGQGAMAVLSRYPILTDRVQSHDDLLWKDLPGADLPEHPDGAPFPSARAQDVQRLSSSGHWAVPVELPGGSVLTILTFHAAPPVFDGPEDRNGRRNAGEIRFWQHWLNGDLGPSVNTRFVLAGDANQDPEEGEGRKEAIRSLLADPRFRDPKPASAGATHGMPGAEDPDETVIWDQVGRLRVDYVLPSSDLQVTDAGVYWPPPGDDGHEAAVTASRHRLVWVDLRIPKE